MFVDCVKSNRSWWMKEGQQATELMIQQDERERELLPRIFWFTLYNNLPILNFICASRLGGDGQKQRMAARTSSVSTSDTTVATDNHIPQYSRRRSSADTKMKVARSRSLETGEGRECSVCGRASRFNCPRCQSPYCSAKCCRDHKSSCI